MPIGQPPDPNPQLAQPKPLPPGIMILLMVGGLVVGGIVGSVLGSLLQGGGGSQDLAGVASGIGYMLLIIFCSLVAAATATIVALGVTSKWFGIIPAIGVALAPSLSADRAYTLRAGFTALSAAVVMGLITSVVTKRGSSPSLVYVFVIASAALIGVQAFLSR
jgi:hypothetical protein